MKIYIERQYDPQRGEIRLRASSGFGEQAYAKSVAVASEAEALRAARQFVAMYRRAGAEVICAV